MSVRTVSQVTAVALALHVTACGDDDVEVRVDAGELDAGELDAGELDAGELDAGELDAGREGGPDAGADAAVDAGVPPSEERLIEVIITDEAFEPARLIVLPGTAVILRLRNEGTVDHGLAVDLPSGTVELDSPVAPQEVGELRFDAPDIETEVVFRDPLAEGIQGTMMVELPPMIRLEELASGMTSPIGMAVPTDETGRRFIVDQVGQIRVLTSADTLLETPFLDLSAQIVELMPGFDERGLLGLAFHPEYATNGRFFVHYSAPLRPGAPDGWDNTSTISEFTVSESDPNRAEPGSERILLQVDQPQFNHAGGTLAFGPDDMLYISLGDGGGAHDVGMGHTEGIGNAQDITKLLGSILRIDVDGGDPYGIPSTNPFVGEEGRDEIFAYGLRNPYRFSFDVGGSNRLFVGDAGQELWEEISIVELGGNYGWNIMEGTHCFSPETPTMPPATCSDVGPNGEPLWLPIIEVPNSNQQGGLAVVIIGGYVYRGAAVPALAGQYVFGAWSQVQEVPSGRLFVASAPGAGSSQWPLQKLGVNGDARGLLEHYVLAFGQDEDGELYVLTTDTQGPTGNTGRVFAVRPAP